MQEDNGSKWREMNNWMMGKFSDENISEDPFSLFNLPENSIGKHKPDYQLILERASRSMIRFRKPERLLKMIVRLIDDNVNTSHTAAFLYKEAQRAYVLVDSKGEDGIKIPSNFIRMTKYNPLIRLFKERQNYMVSDTGTLCYSDMESLLAKETFAKEYAEIRERTRLALKQMDMLKTEVCIPCYYKKDLIGVLLLGAKLSREKFTKTEISFFMTLANDAAMAIANAQLIQRLQEKVQEVKNMYVQERKIFINTSIALAAAIDARDQYTHGHTERVTQYSLAVAEELSGLPEIMGYKNFKETLQIAALLHDVGKIGCPDHILNKPGKLTEEEYAKVKEHPVIGASILTPIRELEDVSREVKSHHERFDGTGYPEGLKGSNIPIIARIIAVCDVFDAITSDRPYRRKMDTKEAIAELKAGLGTQFDPVIVGAFLLSYEKGKIMNSDF